MLSVSFDAALADYRRWIGMSESHSPARKRGRGRPRKTTRIVIAGDFHTPFHDRDALKALIREESASTDELIVNGDLLDFWSCSRFAKASRITDPQAEMREAQAVLCLLAEHFRSIKLIGGNHDSRPRKFLTDHLPPDVLDYISLTGPMVFRPLEFLAAGLSNVSVVEPIRSGHAEFGFLYQLGDAVFTHAEKYSRIPGKSATEVLHWLKSFAEPQRLVTGVRCIVQAHSHAGGTVCADYGALAIDGGCMSTLQEYHGTPKIQTPRPLATGWTVLLQQGGVTDLRESRFRPYVP
jgi:hypothetical protein